MNTPKIECTLVLLLLVWFLRTGNMCTLRELLIDTRQTLTYLPEVIMSDRNFVDR